MLSSSSMLPGNLRVLDIQPPNGPIILRPMGIDFIPRTHGGRIMGEGEI